MGKTDSKLSSNPIFALLMKLVRFLEKVQFIKRSCAISTKF